MSISDRIRSRAEDLELERRAADLLAEAEKVVFGAIEKAGTLAHEHRDDIDAFLAKATARIDERTSGRYADHVSRLRDGVERRVTQLADQRSAGDQD